MDNKLKKEAEQFKDYFSREIVIRKPDVKEDSRAIRGVIATELPVIVMDWYRWEPVREVLLVDGGNIPDKVPLLDAHSRFEISNIKGSCTNFDYEADKELGMILVGDNVFSSTAEKEFTLAKEGHLDSTSIGYRVYDSESVRVDFGKEIVIEDRTFRNDYADKLPLIIRKKWDLLENSLVPIGADKAAKFRSMFSNVSLSEVEGENIIKEIREAVNETSKQLKIIINKEGQSKMDENTKLQEDQRRNSIDALANDFKDKVKGINLVEMSKLYKDGEKAVNEFSDLIIRNIEEQSSVAKPTVDIPVKDLVKYSISRAIAYQMDPRNENCLEAEISQEYKKQTGYKSDGIVIPHKVMDFKRVVNTTATTGGEFIGTDHLGGEFIDTLKNTMVTQQLGVRILSGRKGNIEIPKLSTGNTFGWAATENAQVGASSPVTTKVTMSPKRGGFYVDISKQAIIQSDPVIDQILTDDCRMMLGLGLDAGFFHGSGSAGQFSGLAALTNVGSFSGASLDWKKVLNFPKTLKIANAGNLGEMKFAFNANVEAQLMGRSKESGFPQYIIGEDGKLAGRTYVESNQINDGYMFFGAFGQSYIALWDALDVTVDALTLAREFEVRITFNQLADCAFRYPGAFVVVDDFS